MNEKKEPGARRDSLRPVPVSRRAFLKTLGGSAVVASLPATAISAPRPRQEEDAEVLGPGEVEVTLQINGEARKVEVEPRETLLDVLRDRLGLTGAKKVCDMGECGACTVLIDDVPHYACLLLAVEARAGSITTVEGLRQDDGLTPVQEAFAEADAFQCGFCTPGWVMAVEGLLRRHPVPSEARIHRALSGNLCRCAAYPKILEATRAAARGGK